MESKNKWIDLSILGLCTVGLLGVLLRSKIVFALPFINYNHLLEAHSHFTFGGWVTLALMTLMIYELLPPDFNKKPVYQWLLRGIAVSVWCMLIAFLSEGYSTLSIVFLTFFILLTYIFGYIFIKDILKAKLSMPVYLTAISSVACLIISSSGPFIIIYIYFTNSIDAILYRDALFTYLHFQYNGFFSLAIFALLFNYLVQNISARAKKNISRFTIVLCLSILPSLFLSYLWQDPNELFRIIAIGGSFFVLLSFFLFINVARSLRSTFNAEKPAIRFLIFLSMGSFMLKLFLQCFTIFPLIGNAIFGNRPIIMGFLHLVFLGFVSLSILVFFVKTRLLCYDKKLTKIALIVFAIGIIFNEVLLISQGLVTMFNIGSNLFPWLLWVAGIWLFTGTILITIARIQTKQMR
jgi:hypothetical protein